MPRRPRRRRLSQGNLIADLPSDIPQTPAKGDGAVHVPPTPFADLGVNDDVAERQFARRVRRKSIGGMTPRSARRRGSRKSPYLSGRRSGRRPKKLNETDLSAMYTKAIHLSQRGKINVKNAWNLDLVDHIQDVIKLDDAQRDATNFQRASHTIDAASKIYGVRVDAMYADTYKYLGSMNQQNETDEVNAGEDGPRRRILSRKTISDGGIINESEKELIESVDPLFHKTASAFDEGGARGLLMNQLYVQNGVEIVFDSETKLDKCNDESPLSFEEEQAELERDRNWTEHLAATILSETAVDQLPENAFSQFAPDIGDSLNTDIDLEWLNTAEICPLLTEFEHGIRELSALRPDSMHRPDQVPPPESGPLDEVNNQLNFDDVLLNDDFANEPPMEDSGAGGLDLPFAGSMDAGDNMDDAEYTGFNSMLHGPALEMDDAFEAQRLEAEMVNRLENDELPLDPTYNTEVQVVGQVQRYSNGPNVVGSLSSSLNMMTEMMQTVDLTDLENMTTFFDPKKHGNWAGPEHWHYRRSQLVKAKEDHDQDLDEKEMPQRRGRKRKATEYIDFVSIGDGELLDETLFAPPPRSSSCLTAAVLKKHEDDFHVLPEDHQLKPIMFTRMFQKPNYSVYAHWRAWKDQQNFRPKPIVRHIVDDGLGDFAPAGSDDAVDDGHFDYDYNNPIDASFIPQLPNGAVEEDREDEGGFPLQMFSFEDASFQLVQAPRKVEQIQVSFAVKSKKVDVSRLKRVMWDDIHSSSKDASPNEENQDPNGAKDCESVVTFQRTIASIVSQIEPRQVDQLSISFCFMCLLHLANEKNLSLEARDQAMGDFFVRLDGELSREPSADQAFFVGDSPERIKNKSGVVLEVQDAMEDIEEF